MPHFSPLIKLGISLLLLVYLFSQLDLAAAEDLLRRFEPIYLVPVLMLGLFGILLSTWKWFLILKAICTPPPFTAVLRLFWIGLFFNNFLPGRTGGDLVRIYGLSRTIKNSTHAAFSVVADRGLNLMSFFIIGLIAFYWSAKDQTLGFSLHHRWGWIALAFLPFALLVFPRVRRVFQTERLKHHFQDLREAIKSASFSQIATTSLLAMLYQISVILSHVVVARGFGQTLAVEHFFYVVPLTAIATSLPISLNGIGIREGAFALAFLQLGASADAGIALSLTITLVTMATSAIGGIFYALDAPKQISKTLSPQQNELGASRP